MSCNKLWRLATAVALMAIVSEQASAASGAYAVDDADIGKPGDCKIESWASFGDNRDRAFVASPACVVNLGVPVELGAQVTRSRVDGVWSTSFGPKAKINIVPSSNGVGIGLTGAATWDQHGQSVGSLVNVPVTFQARENVRINLNLGWAYDAMARVSYLNWGAGFEWEFIDKVTLIGEVYGLAGKTIAQETDPRAQVGLRFTPVKALDLDVIYGRNINGRDSHWITTGVNFRF